MTANDRTGIADRIAADFYIITKHGTELLNAGFHQLRPVVDDHKLLIALHVAGDGTSSHMAIVTEDAVTDVVVMRSLDMIEPDHVLQLDAVADNTVSADKGGTAVEGAVPHLSIRSDDARRAEVSRRENFGGLMDPDSGLHFFIIISKSRTKLKDQFIDSLQRLPGISKPPKVIGCQGVVKVILIFLRFSD